MEYFRVELLIVCIIASIQFTETAEIVRETEHFTDYLRETSPMSTIRQLSGLSKGKYTTLRFHYNITLYNYRKENSAPLVHFRHVGEEGEYETEDGCIGGAGVEQTLGFDTRLLELREFERKRGKDKECVLDPYDNTILRCTGSLRLAVGLARQWYTTIGFRCNEVEGRDENERGPESRGQESRGQEPRGQEPRGQESRGHEPRGQESRSGESRDQDEMGQESMGQEPMGHAQRGQALNLEYHFVIEAFDRVECHSFDQPFSEIQDIIPKPMEDFIQQCATYYDSFARYNVLGLDEYDIFNGFAVAFALRNAQCFQRADLASCATNFPKCINGTVHVICNETCTELITGCPEILGDLRCNSLASRHANPQCPYEPVQCLDQPEVPKHATISCPNCTAVTSIQQLTCDKGYEASGNPIRKCEYSGLRSYDPLFMCKKKRSIIPVVSVGVAIVVAAIIVGCAVCIKCKAEINLLRRTYTGKLCCGYNKLFSKRNIYFQRKRFNAAFWYADEDEEQIREIIEKLESLKPNYQFYADYKAVRQGSNYVEWIPEIVLQAYVSIIFLSNAFLQSDECQCVLRHSLNWLEEDNYFSVQIIAMEDPKRLRDMPIHLKPYIKTGTYMKVLDSKLIRKLLKVLPNPDKAPTQVMYTNRQNEQNETPFITILPVNHDAHNGV